jgi:2'-5' RNA ligase
MSMSKKLPRVCAVVTARMPGDQAAGLRNWSKTAVRAIAPLARDASFEERPHVTVRWGLLVDLPDDVYRACEGVGPFTYTLGKTVVFPTRSHDTLAIAVRPCPEFEELHRRLADLPALRDAFSFRPHVTLMRVDRGKAAKLANLSDFDGKRVFVDRLVFSTRAREETVIPLHVAPAGVPEPSSSEGAVA